MWRAHPYSVRIPYIQNAMSRGAYVFMRRYIHFADNHRQAEKGQPGYDALYKVRYPLDIMMAGIRAALTDGKHVAVDESMIRYMGGAVTYVQYMPAKPIKHGMKVFCLCCAISAVLLSFKVYVSNQGGGEASRDCWDACSEGLRYIFQRRRS